MRPLAVLVFALLALPPATVAADGFTDPRGDAAGGPDIVSVTLSHTDEELRIAVEFAADVPLAFDEAERYTDMLLIGIHSDDDLRRADVEFWTGVHAIDLEQALVVAAGRARGVVGRADVSVDGSTVTLDLARSLLGDPDRIAVQLAAGREYVDGREGEGEGDFAPALGSHRYELAGGRPWVWPLLAGGAALLALVALAAVIVARRSVRPY